MHSERHVRFTASYFIWLRHEEQEVGVPSQVAQFESQSLHWKFAPGTLTSTGQS